MDRGYTLVSFTIKLVLLQKKSRIKIVFSAVIRHFINKSPQVHRKCTMGGGKLS